MTALLRIFHQSTKTFIEMYFVDVLQYFSFVVVVLVASSTDFSFHFCFADVSLSQKAKETCPSTDPNCELNSRREGDYQLYQIDGVKVCTCLQVVCLHFRILMSIF